MSEFPEGCTGPFSDDCPVHPRPKGIDYRQLATELAKALLLPIGDPEHARLVADPRVQALLGTEPKEGR